MCREFIKNIPWSGVGVCYTEEEIKFVAEVMRSTRDSFSQGKYLDKFENDFCKYNGNAHAFAVSSCTAALELSATLSGVGPGDEVVIPAHTFCASAISFARKGVKIVWADIDPDTLVVTAETLSEKITSKTKVIVVVHLYGLAADMPPIMELASKKNIIVVEDCAQALGAKSNGKKAGTYGDFGCFSFHTHKNISTLGEGGILTVKDPKLSKLVPGLRHNGLRGFDESREYYWIPAMGNVDFDIDNVWPYNFCIGEVQCALGDALLNRIDDLIEKRKKRGLKFINALNEYNELIFQKIPDGQTSSWHLLPARYDGKQWGKTKNDFIEEAFNKYKIKMAVQYYPLYRYPIFQKAGLGDANCPATEAFFDNMVSFPFHSWMPDDDFDYMINATIEVLEKLRK
ncbi:MAG: DegT/DnrJ/EryC1/StrS family aminotransferase [Candidatus Scalinduaceae bacterium]